MRSSSTNVGASDFLRGVPLTLGALLVVVLAVDVLLAAQPALIDQLSAPLRSALTLRSSLMPPVHVLAAALAVASVVLASAVLLAFAHATRRAPALSLGPAWVTMCMLSVARNDVQLPLPLHTPEFVALSGLLIVAGGVALRSQSSAGRAIGWLAALLPLAILGGGSARAQAPRPELIWLGSALLLAALGVLLIARLRPSEPTRSELPGLEGVDVVEELFAQVERAERSEARAQDLERQLNALTRSVRGRTLTR